MFFKTSFRGETKKIQRPLEYRIPIAYSEPIKWLLIWKGGFKGEKKTPELRSSLELAGRYSPIAFLPLKRGWRVLEKGHISNPHERNNISGNACQMLGT